MIRTWAGVILAGGAAKRLGGADKRELRVGGRTLLEHAHAALGRADEVLVLGPETSGGPAAAILAATRALPHASWLVVLAVDMPWVTADTVGRLLAAAEGRDGAMLDDGRPQFLAAAYRTAALPALARPEGTSVRRLLDGLDLAAVPARGDEARDIDTWDDLTAE